MPDAATYARLKAAGICVRCGKAPATRGCTCEPCYQRKRASDVYRFRKQHWTHQQARTCLWCGEPAQEGNRLCARHAKLHREATRRTKVRRQQEGLCKECGEPLSEMERMKGAVTCGDCSDARRLRANS